MTRPVSRVRAGDREVDVRVTGEGVLVDGERFVVSPVVPGTWRVAGTSGASLVHVVADADGWWVHAEGAVHRIERAEPGARPRERARHGREHDLAAPMPAAVIAVHASPGQQVTAGETLVVLEAMKMELPLRAPRDGVVSSVHCRAGDMVQPGVVLVELA